MKVEIIVKCIDGGRVPRHHIVPVTIRGDVRINRLVKNIIEMIREKYLPARNTKKEIVGKILDALTLNEDDSLADEIYTAITPYIKEQI